MKKILFAAAILTAVVISAFASASTATHFQEFYTVHAADYPVIKTKEAIDTCMAIKKAGYMAYHVKNHTGSRHVITIMLGAYDTKEQAASAAAEIKEKFGITCRVMKTKDITVTKFRDKFSIISTPNGVWQEKNGVLKELVCFGKEPKCRNFNFENNASITEDGSKIVLFSQGNIIKIDLGSGVMSELVKGRLNGVALNKCAPQWSPDGKSIAFMDNFGDGVETSLYVMNADGSGIKKLVDNKGAGKAVLSFSWAPAGDRLLFVESASGITAGRMMTAKMDGAIEPVRSLSGEEMIDRHFKISGNKVEYSVVKPSGLFSDKMTADERQAVIF